MMMVLNNEGMLNHQLTPDDDDDDDVISLSLFVLIYMYFCTH